MPRQKLDCCRVRGEEAFRDLAPVPHTFPPLTQVAQDDGDADMDRMKNMASSMASSMATKASEASKVAIEKAKKEAVRRT